LKTIAKVRVRRRDGAASANAVHRGDREVWTQTSDGWFREQLGPPETGGYPRPGTELRLIERFLSLTGREIIEIGCGDGRLTFQYAPRARRVVALDANAAEIERARAEADRIGARNIRFLARPARGRLPGAPFDVALFTWSL
jgi:methylase of polypeptide subunit release factors